MRDDTRLREPGVSRHDRLPRGERVLDGLSQGRGLSRGGQGWAAKHQESRTGDLTIYQYTQYGLWRRMGKANGHIALEFSYRPL